jgi:hypothetical protein
MVTNKRLICRRGTGVTPGSILLEADKTAIESVEVRRSFLSKKCIVTLINGSSHTFDYGVLNISKCAAAIMSA